MLFPDSQVKAFHFFSPFVPFYDQQEILVVYSSIKR